MNRSLIADRYAKALFKLAIEQDKLEQVHADVALLQQYCKEADGFMDILVSPVIKPSRKKQMFQDVLKGKIDKSTMRLLDLLVDNNREELLTDINRHFIHLFKENKGIKEVAFYTAVAMDVGHIDQLKVFLKEQFKAPIELSVKIKPELLGGFILTVDGKMVDASISSKLKQIKKELLS